MVWILSSVPLSQTLHGLHLPSMFFPPPSFLWLGDLAFVPSCFTKSYSGCSFCLRGLGFYGLISGGVNCSDQEVVRGWCFPPWLAETRGRNELHSFECRKSMWTVKALESVSNSYSWFSLKCGLFYVDCNAHSILLSFSKEPSVKFVLQCWWFGPLLLLIRQWKSSCILSYVIAEVKQQCLVPALSGEALA